MKSPEMDRRAFLSSTSRLAVAGTAYLAGSGVTRLFASMQNPPYEIVVIGDGIAWGAGLKEDEKFTHKVAAYVKQKMPGTEVHIHQFAHAGARILADAAADEKAPPHAEVPSPSPSVTWQLSRAERELSGATQRRYVPSIHAQVNREQVALVILSGGLDDVGLTNILTPDSTAMAAVVRQATRERCVARMKKLLPAAAATFPNAKVIATSYYALVSAESDAAQLPDLLQFHGIPTDKADSSEVLLNRLARQCTAFHEEAMAGLREAVAGASMPKMIAGKPGVAPVLGQRRPLRRIALADPGFAPANAYAAKNSFLFRLTDADPAAPVRKPQCVEAGENTDRCLLAATGFPNQRGADAYANAVIGALQQLTPEWSAR